jgi:hypothetical protein
MAKEIRPLDRTVQHSVWKSIPFCLCEGQDLEIDNIIDKYMSNVQIFQTKARRVPQNDYNREAIFVNDYAIKHGDHYYTIQANIVLASYISGKWHRVIDQVFAWRHKAIKPAYPKVSKVKEKVYGYPTYKDLGYRGDPRLSHLNERALKYVEESINLTDKLKTWRQMNKHQVVEFLKNADVLDAISFCLLYYPEIYVASGK